MAQIVSLMLIKIFLEVIRIIEYRYWDDWIRQPNQRKERACIRPEISRTKTFGKIGVSKYVIIFSLIYVTVYVCILYILVDYFSKSI